ncbi:MAG: TolC family protein [Bacteroidales bacterium]|nr:TolC family protein [Bacteroidales bacterium]MDT8372775.1 TolC family protein [Bacteroidales bacterium]
MIKKLFILTVIIFIAGPLSAQSITEYLERVSENNPSITAYRKLLEARRTEARTGNAPPDPFVSAGFMPGNTDAAGNKKTWSVSQSFDFPTKYLMQKKINNNTIILAEQEFSLGRMNALLEAELTIFDLIYNTRALEKLLDRQKGYETLKSTWGRMIENGEATIMDYNNILLELSVVSLEIYRRESDREMLMEKLHYMSGSEAGEIVYADYPVKALPDPELLITEKSRSHPAFLISELEYTISQQEVRLSKNASLPGFQVGYGSEIVAGTAYTGPIAGLSIPLWANSNRVRSASAAADYLEAFREATLLELKLKTRNDYNRVLALKKSISEIRSIIEAGGGTKYPDKALAAGEITVVNYCAYMKVLYESEDRLMELENEYHKVLATLLDYRLCL